MEYKLTINEETTPVEVETKEGNLMMFSINQHTYEVKYALISDFQVYLNVNGLGYNAYISEGTEGKSVVINGVEYLVEDADAQKQKSRKKGGAKDGPREVTPVTPSVVISILVKEGDLVEKRQGVIVLSAMKMEVTLSAPYSGKVTSINTAENEHVSPGDILIDIEKDESDQEDKSNND